MEIPLKVLVRQSKGGRFWAEVPALPGCVSEADTLEELGANVREAIDGWIDAGNDRAPEPGPDDAGSVQVIVL